MKNHVSGKGCDQTMAIDSLSMYLYLAVERLRNLSCVASHAAGFAKLYLEVADSSTNKLVNLKNDSIMFFLKYFDIHQQKIM